MPRNITTAQKSAQDSHKSDTLGQTNRSIFSRTKNRNKNPGHVFLDFTLFFNIAVEKFGKFFFVKLELSSEIFLNTEYPDFGSKC